MTELVVGEPECPNCSGGVTTADHSEAVDLGERLSDGFGAGREGGELEHAHGTVPEHRACTADVLGEQLSGLRADVEAEAVRTPIGVFDRVDGPHSVFCIRAELRR